MSPLAQVTFSDHGGGSGEDETEDQCGVPEREMETTDQPRWAAARQMRLPGGCQCAVVQESQLRGPSWGAASSGASRRRRRKLHQLDHSSQLAVHTEKTVAAAHDELLLYCRGHRWRGCVLGQTQDGGHMQAVKW